MFAGEKDADFEAGSSTASPVWQVANIRQNGWITKNACKV